MFIMFARSVIRLSECQKAVEKLILPVQRVGKNSAVKAELSHFFWKIRKAKAGTSENADN